MATGYLTVATYYLAVPTYYLAAKSIFFFSYVVQINNKPILRRRVWRYQRGNQTESVNRRRTNNTMAKRKGANNDLQNITHKTKDRVTRTPLKGRGGGGGEFICLFITPLTFLSLRACVLFTFFMSQTYIKCEDNRVVNHSWPPDHTIGLNVYRMSKQLS